MVGPRCSNPNTLLACITELPTRRRRRRIGVNKSELMGPRDVWRRNNKVAGRVKQRKVGRGAE